MVLAAPSGQIYCHLTLAPAGPAKSVVAASGPRLRTSSARAPVLCGA